jgi:hypothetical protein
VDVVTAPIEITPDWIANSNEFEASVGRMVVTFAHLEGNLRMLICLLVGGSQTRVHAMLTKLRFRNLIDTLVPQVAMATSNAHRIAAVEEWATRANKVNERRNRYVHNQLVFGEEEGKLVSGHYHPFLKKGRFIRRLERVSIEDIRALGSEMSRLSNELVGFLDEFIAEGVLPKTAAKLLMRPVAKEKA